MKRFTIGNLTNLFLLLTGTGFLTLFIILSFNNRLASDDLYFLAMIKKEGIWGCFKGVYMGWGGRWMATAYLFFVMTLTDNYQHIHYFLFAYHLVTLLVLVVSLQAILRFLFLELFQTEVAKKEALIFAVLFIASFYFFTFDIIESWWWVCSSFVYLQGISFLLAGIALLIRKQQHLFSYCCMGFCFLYVGGCFEIYALIVLGLFISFVAYGKKTGKWNGWKQKGYLKAFFVALICLLVSTLICFMAPGNYQRIGVIGDLHIIYPSSFFRDLGLAITFMFQKKLGVAILLSSLWMVMGMKLKENNNDPLLSKRVRNVLLICLATVAGSTLINEIFKMIILKNMLMPPRAFTFTSLSITALMCLLFLLLGNYFLQKAKRLTFLMPFISCISMIILFACVYKQYGSTSTYAKQYDEVISNLLIAKEQAQKEVVVHALPDPGMLLPLEEYATLKEILDLPDEITVITKVEL